MSRRDELVAALVKLEAHRRGLAKLRAGVHARATEQRDAVDGDLHTVTGVQEAGQGGILVHRMARTLLSDRDRLERIRE